MHKTTIQEIAKMANVSTASVDRVLNNRKGVSQKTKNRVLTAFQTLSNKTVQIKKQSQVIAFLLPADNPFSKNIADTLQDVNASTSYQHLGIKIIPYNIDNMADIKQKTDDLLRFKNIVLFAPDNDFFNNLIKELKQKNKTVLTIVSDLPNSDRDCYIGIDNSLIGRCVANLFHKHCQHQTGDIVIILPDNQQLQYQQRLQGIKEYMQEKQCPNLNLLDPIFSNEDITSTQQQLYKILKNNKNVIGIYNSGCELRATHNVFQDLSIDRQKICLISQELTHITKSLFKSNSIDYLIAQPLNFYALELLEYFNTPEDYLNKTEIIGRTRIYIESNIPI